MKLNTIAAFAVLAGSFAFAGDDCTPQQSPTPAGSAVDQQREQATQEVATEQMYSYEVNNIKKRRVLFGKPGVIGYVVFLNQSGQPIQYLTVDGKCTSSGKRISPTEELKELDAGGDHWQWDVIPAIGEDGVYGTSENYIYCFGTDGVYHQWSGDYLYSDKPINLIIKPLVISTSGKIQGQ